MKFGAVKTLISLLLLTFTYSLPCDRLTFAESRGQNIVQVAAAPFSDDVWSLGTKLVKGGFIL